MDRDAGFAGRVVCGRADYAGQLKKDGTPMWHCPFKFPRDYYVLVNEKGDWVASADERETLVGRAKNGLKIEKAKYEGCPAFSFDKRIELL